MTSTLAGGYFIGLDNEVPDLLLLS